MFNWLSAKKSEEFGSELARLLVELIPNYSSLSESKRLSKTNYAKDKLKPQLLHFKQEEILNFYKIAKLLNAFKWSLKDAGFDEPFTNSFAKWILICLHSKNS